jgi:hypothetical protein
VNIRMDLVEANAAAIDEWNKGSADTTQMLQAVAAAASVIERQVRERIAADLRQRANDLALSGHGSDSTVYREIAARIARGES